MVGWDGADCLNGRNLKKEAKVLLGFADKYDAMPSALTIVREKAPS